ncbi:MAG: ferritin family protein [Candidatus Eisenbacteria bacterium]
MPERKTDRERVEFALKTERDGSDFYGLAKEQTNHKLARAAFELLSKEEMRHVALITALGKHLEGGAAVPSADSPSMGNLQSTLKTIYGSAIEGAGDEKMDPAEAYGTAIELEKKISALYYQYAKDCESDEARRLFDVLYKEEQRHLSLLEDMLAYLTKPDQWFIDRDGTMLDGG